MGRGCEGMVEEGCIGGLGRCAVRDGNGVVHEFSDGDGHDDETNSMKRKGERSVVEKELFRIRTSSSMTCFRTRTPH